jgi:hypothetical protein
MFTKLRPQNLKMPIVSFCGLLYEAQSYYTMNE